MPHQDPLSSAIIHTIAQQLTLPTQSVAATLALLTEGGTVPFIARYRKEATGNLDEVAIGAIEERAGYFKELEERRTTVLNSIREQGKLTDELKAQIERTMEKSVLEDLYLPYRPKRRTKASIAREKGLEPLATYLWDQQPIEVPLVAYAEQFVSSEKGVGSIEEALEGARHIIAERISETAEFRGHLRQMMLADGMVVSHAVEGAEDPDGKFKMYFDYREPAAKNPHHLMLAIRRGTNENIHYF